MRLTKFLSGFTAAMKRIHGDSSPDKVQKLLKVMWTKEIGLAYMPDILKQKNKLQNLCNSDGHKIIWCTLEFELAAPREDVVYALQEVNEFIIEENTKKRSFYSYSVWI